ncbi:MAG TPA: double-strand break repair helicase AddA, partial [Alphaproteobacteria bacterium]|nr:double-strand break repair helicase AddA [Alphaproteobacteria bacterium]
MRPERNPEPKGPTPQHWAADPGTSIWVTASAGTGKTSVLTDRVLRLLLAGTEPERILCITYTKAAAAEMALRIEDRLALWASQSEEKGREDLAVLLGRAPRAEEERRARTLLLRVLDAPGGLKIQTIHAFCQSLLARFPLEARIAPHFQVAEERDQRDMLKLAVENVLATAREGGEQGVGASLAGVATQASESGFHELMAAIAGKREKLERLLQRHGGLVGMARRLYEHAGLAWDDTPERLLKAAAEDGAFDAPALENACAALASGTPAERQRAEAIGRWLRAPLKARLATFEDYAGLYLTQAKEAGRTPLITKAREAASGGTAGSALESERERLARLYGRLRALALRQGTEQLLTLAMALLAAYRDVKEHRARLDYDDQILYVRDLLARPGIAPWVLYKLDGGIDHILLDEAQDTSPEQWAVIAAFAEEFFTGKSAREVMRTVFVVGDEKQSIFSFQGAEPRQLERMRTRLAAQADGAREPWREVPLDRSYRSTPPVLAAVDAVFAQDEARRGVALSGQAIHHSTVREGEAGLVELWPLLLPRQEGEPEPWRLPLRRRAADQPPVRLARHIAGVIRGWLDGGEALESQGRAVAPGDILILVRARGSFAGEMVRALKERSVPVAGVDRLYLTLQLAVMDLAALGHFLLLPEDDLTLATVLKSPLIGFSEDELFELAATRGELALWRSLERRKAERAAFGDAHALLSELLARTDFVPPFELYEDLLSRLGARARLLERLGPEAEDAIDEFLNAALDYETSHAPSLQGFLDWLFEAPHEVKRDPEQGRDEVR